MGAGFRNSAAEPSSAGSRSDRLLAIAAKVFLERGFEGTSVGEIASRANASKGTFYSRYPSKERLFEAVVRKCADESFEELNRILLDADPESALTGLGARLLDLVLAPESIDLMRIVYMESRHFPELGKIFYEAGPGRVRVLLAEYLRQQMEKGVFIEAPERIAAEQFLDSLLGELVRRAALGLNPEPTKKQRKRRLESAVRMFLRAYRV